MLPNNISLNKRPLPVPKLRDGTSSKSTGAPSHISKVKPSAISAINSRSSEIFEHVKPEILPDVKDDKKKGRPSRAERLKEAQARMSETLHALLSRDPGKKEIRAFFESRIKELA